MMVKPMLWIHGWGASSQVWQEIALSFSDRDHHFADFSSCNDMAEFHQEIQQTLSSHAGPWMLVGWSMGALLALETWMLNEQHQRHQIEAIVIISATLRFVDQDRTKGWPRRILERMSKQLAANPEQVLSQFKQSMLTATERDTLNDKSKQLLNQTDYTLEGLQAGLKYLMETDLREVWNQRTASPSNTRWLCIHGSDDEICPIGAMPACRDEEKLVIPGAGHVPFLTAKDTVLNHVRSFLYEHQ